MRNLNKDRASDLKLFLACCNQIMTKATGRTESWNVIAEVIIACTTTTCPAKRIQLKNAFPQKWKPVPHLSSLAIPDTGQRSSKLRTSIQHRNRSASSLGLLPRPFRPQMPSKSSFAASKLRWTNLQFCLRVGFKACDCGLKGSLRQQLMTMTQMSQENPKALNTTWKVRFCHCFHIIGLFVGAILPINFVQVFLSEV